MAIGLVMDDGATTIEIRKGGVERAATVDGRMG
jgi:hypothetical protein